MHINTTERQREKIDVTFGEAIKILRDGEEVISDPKIFPDREFRGKFEKANNNTAANSVAIII